MDSIDLSVVIPTRDRRPVLCETLARLEQQSGGVTFVVVVVDDGSRDGTTDAVRDIAARGALDLELIEQPALGPAAARNRAIAETGAPVCVFMNDDSWPWPDLVARHAAFHARNPEPTAALLGSIVVPPEPPPSPFMRWLGDALFDYGSIDDPDDAGGERFFTANVSAKTELLRESGGFHEDFPTAAYEDLDLGLRLERCGMRLIHDPAAVVEHAHPMDLAGAIARLRAQGRAMAPFVERNPDWPVPRPPGVRHRVKSGALTALAATGLRTPRLQREIWRFLCHEASREGYWSAQRPQEPVDGPSGNGLRIGRRLESLAIRDEDTRMPAGYAELA